jgi:glycosyltransferase involved in cell wall biosynthesis
MKTVLWWGRFDPEYSRNRILRRLLAELGWTVRDFRPRLSVSGDFEAALRRPPVPDLVWVPAFRQRDIAAASRWARRHDVPLLFDPMISAYDKQVDERGKYAAGSRQARRVRAWERDLFRRADRVLADTPAHAAFFARLLGVRRERIAVVWLGAEEALFMPAPAPVHAPGERPEVLFFGSFIPLQGPQVVIEAARVYIGPPVRWTLLGNGPLRGACEQAAQGLDHVRFEDWLPYPELPARIHRADLLLGIFGTSPKAGRVIPNKVCQALACGRPVVTRRSEAYPAALRDAPDAGLVWTEAGDAQSLADGVAALVSDPERLRRQGQAAAATSQQFFSSAIVREQLRGVLESLPVRV